MDREPSISEKSKVSIALVALMLPALWFFAADHNTVTSLSRDRDELRQDVKEIKGSLNAILVQMAATNRRNAIDPASYSPPVKNGNGR